MHKELHREYYNHQIQGLGKLHVLFQERSERSEESNVIDMEKQ